MNKGFMFSIEMLSIMTVLIVAAAAITSFLPAESADTTVPNIVNAGKTAMGIYYGGDGPMPDGNNIFCRKIAWFNPDSNSIEMKSICGAIS